MRCEEIFKIEHVVGDFLQSSSVCVSSLFVDKVHYVLLQQFESDLGDVDDGILVDDACYLQLRVFLELT